MLKVKKLKISGFRGILEEKEINFVQSRTSSSLAVFGLNSTGKSSFIDGIEWLLSQDNEIEWLKRENAGVRAYPHQEAAPDTSFVEIEFEDDTKELDTLRKTYNNTLVTRPILSSASDFQKLHSSFVIKPYLRYQEIIEFIFDYTGRQKYEILAGWMGFEDELRFQEKLALKIIPDIEKRQHDTQLRMHSKKDEITELVGADVSTEYEILEFANAELLKRKISPFSNYGDLTKGMEELSSKNKLSKEQEKSVLLADIASSLPTITLSNVLVEKLKTIEELIKKIKKEQESVDKIDYLQLYEIGLKIITEYGEEDVLCPLCGTSWEKEHLTNEIRSKFEKINQLKEDREKLSSTVMDILPYLSNEQQKLTQINTHYTSSSKHLTIDSSNLVSYEQVLEDVATELKTNALEVKISSTELNDSFTATLSEKESILTLIQAEVKAIGAKNETALLEITIQKILKLIELWNQLKKWESAFKFYSDETQKFIEICQELSGKIQDNVIERFKTISTRIEEYFKVLRSDKDIKDIQLELNTETQRATGRSAEIKLSYFDLEVKPAYKVLSESLLNSLGLAVYFTCVKEFNKDCKFVVLDDIMNSLDTGHRDSLLDLIDQEFSDYQVILFTHDEFWFQKIKSKFPSWIHKKIKSWEYSRGPVIEKSNTTMEDIDELLKDNAKARDAGYKLALHVEDTLNELCENIQAEIKYRYHKSNPPTLDELFVGFHKRTVKVLGNTHATIPLIEAVQNTVPTLRNFADHSKANYASSISPTEVESVKNEWSNLEKEIHCGTCHKYISFIPLTGKLSCRCGGITLFKT